MPIDFKFFCFNFFKIKTLTSILIVFIGGNIFSAEGQPKLDASCTAKEFETIRLKQNCLLKTGKDNSCFMSTMVDAMQGSSVAQANLMAFSADLPLDLRDKLSKVVDKVKELSRPNHKVPISSSILEAASRSNHSPDAWDDIITSDRARQIVRQALQENFPKEMQQLMNSDGDLRQLINASRKIYEAKFGRSDDMYTSWNKHYWNGEQRQIEDEIIRQHANKKTALLAL